MNRILFLVIYPVVSCISSNSVKSFFGVRKPMLTPPLYAKSYLRITKAVAGLPHKIDSVYPC